MTKTYNILFICAGNSARSVLGEALATTLSHGRFIGYSAGTDPEGEVHSEATKMAKEMGYPANLLRSKSWDEFAREGSPHMDFIITLCDEAAGEECPYWPGHPATAHWGIADPAHDNQTPEEAHNAFKKAEMALRNRLELLLDLPDEKLHHLEISDHLENIHKQFA
ncbi:arsenate reductase [Polynucleobacter meluiroseus]|uniref:Arsenate reductase n=1 Tax=Polynucleobacter meluiroseus TaxID=1938814 RepID=A0A240E2W3_9BURK|nr:arsenate reductase ArsC [Polynucleobacter meluiroseus]SNX29542.1 arsenate reductase [Polynucleobacter meluiroseus]